MIPIQFDFLASSRKSDIGISAGTPQKLRHRNHISGLAWGRLAAVAARLASCKIVGEVDNLPDQKGVRLLFCHHWQTKALESPTRYTERWPAGITQRNKIITLYIVEIRDM